ncbi:DUF4921 family protein [Gephyromycinifex aptenodytis]|uniref:DUF4921 family protein n=1 Tax=Gephyromycinifex aptenodytis TaxID=2716227 RepID=UPI00144657E4|nr:DUF4921 family protein [Gephyromycinifex aptenodytis]
MDDPYAPRRPVPITLLPDGTIKQINLLSGTQVWTVPGRGQRPLDVAPTPAKPIEPGTRDALCAFCAECYEQTPPEKARVVREGEHWRTLRGVSPSELHATTAEFRRIANLFEIVGYDYWRANHGVQADAQALAHRDAYLSCPSGREHAFGIAWRRFQAAGGTQSEWDLLPEAERVALTTRFFAGGHDVIVARRHLRDGADTADALASSGSLQVEEHRHYLRFTIEAMADLYAKIPAARYVVAFQNWLKPAGASFDHLHKQLVAIDEFGRQIEAELPKAQADPDLYNALALDYAAREGLVLAENEHAVAFAGFGHRYPTLEVYSRSTHGRPWEASLPEQDAMSDLVHAMHAATGPAIPCNEEWQHQPPSCSTPMPWRIQLKWRISTLAGFEGGSRIYLNTISPGALRDQVLANLMQLREQGRIAPKIALGAECPVAQLRYSRG